MKQMLIRTACNAGAALRAAFGPLRAESTHLLMYHRVAAPAPGVKAPTLNVPPEQFARQMKGLLDRGYTFWSLRRLVEAAEAGESAPPKTLAVTFDDGYENMYTRVFPIVRQLDIPITIFVCTKWIDSEIPLPFDHWGWEHRRRVPAECWRPLSWEQCREMHESKRVEIAAHSHSHGDFRGNVDEFAADMADCVSCLHEHLGVEHPNFAFPFGRVDEGFATAEMIEAARCSGVASALTTEPGVVDFADSPFAWGRNNVFPWDDAATIDARLTGWYQWLPTSRRWLRQAFRLARYPLRSPSLPSRLKEDRPQPAAPSSREVRS